MPTKNRLLILLIVLGGLAFIGAALGLPEILRDSSPANLGGGLVGAFLIGLVLAGAATIPASIARSKGRSFPTWWFYGFVLFAVALVHSLLIRPEAKV